ncbi:MAG: PepSY domain-containing protein [Candidatus Thiodiazotropha sp.]
MKLFISTIFGILIFANQAVAISKSDIRTIIKDTYPGARITEIEKETYKGDKVYEVDFVHKGKRLEAILNLDGSIIKVRIDD